MNCHGDNKEKKDINKHSPLKHILHMVLCCGLPIVIIAILPFIAKFSPSGAGILGIIAPFICPVMMGVMMFTMFRGKKRSCCDNTNENRKEKYE
jgi:uncharacterized membrane-anchored protein